MISACACDDTPDCLCRIIKSAFAIARLSSEGVAATLTTRYGVEAADAGHRGAPLLREVLLVVKMKCPLKHL
jgi:hypothetical protein